MRVPNEFGKPRLDVQAGASRMLRSTACTECVSAPIEMKLTPASAYSRTFSSVIPPEASSGSEPAQPGNHLHRLAHLCWRHVVEQHRLSAMVENQLEFVERAHLDLDGLRSPPIAQSAL